MIRCIYGNKITKMGIGSYAGTSAGMSTWCLTNPLFPLLYFRKSLTDSVWKSKRQFLWTFCTEKYHNAGRSSWCVLYRYPIRAPSFSNYINNTPTIFMDRCEMLGVIKATIRQVSLFSHSGKFFSCTAVLACKEVISDTSKLLVTEIRNSLCEIKLFLCEIKFDFLEAIYWHDFGKWIRRIV